MKQWFIRIAIVGALLGGAAGIVACSDDDEAMTLEAYIAALDKIDDETTAAIDANFESLSDEPTVEEVKSAFDNLPAELNKAADNADELDPPEDAAERHDALVERLRNFADASEDASEAASGATTVDEFFEQTNTEEFAAAESAFEEACLDMQNYAGEQGITVDLGCTDPEDDAASAAQQAVEDVVAAWNAKDVDAFAALFTDDGLVAVFGGGEPTTREEVLSFLPDVVGDGEVTVREISSEATESGADVTVLWASGRVLESYIFSLVDDEGAWKIDQQEVLPVEPPAGATVLAVDLNEFAFGLDTSLITSSAPIVFNGKNVGTQLHHMVLVKIPEDAVLDELLASDDPQGVEDIAGGEPFPPGESATITLAAPLDSGRYVLVCFLPDTEDPEETPHAFKGMVKEFTIE